MRDAERARSPVSRALPASISSLISYPHSAFLFCILHWVEILHPASISILLSPRSSRVRSYQILALSASGRTIGSPSLHPHAALNSGMLLNGPFTRHIDGACSLEFTCVRKACGRYTSRHTCAQPRKNRCSGVNPSIFACGPEPSALSIAAYATVRPPKSPMFSPSVSFPFTCVDVSSTVYESNCFTTLSACTVYFAASSFAHQSLRLPSLSNWRPWSSKPCVISCPITAPIAP